MCGSFRRFGLPEARNSALSHLPEPEAPHPALHQSFEQSRIIKGPS